MSLLLLFIFGASIGSFINVIVLRYKENGSILITPHLLGRSHCPICNHTLHWFELIPLVSFLLLRGRCRLCKSRIHFQYPLVEAISGILTFVVPQALYLHLGGAALLRAPDGAVFLSLVILIWMLITYTVLTLSVIDIRLRIIPDESNIFLGILGAGLLITRFFLDKTQAYGSFLGSYGEMLGSFNSILSSAAMSVIIALVFFGGIVIITRGRGMGMGDVKLAAPLALILLWPDSLIAFSSAFVIGAVFGVFQMLRRVATMKAMLPFGPFLVAGMYVSMLWGEPILRWYFGLI